MPDADISNADLAKLATIHEHNLNNNNIFAGKNLSDNSKITSYYTLKAMPPYQSPMNYFGSSQKKSLNGTETIRSEHSMSTIVQDLFTNNAVKNQNDKLVYVNKKPEFTNLEETIVSGASTAKVSNLVNKPRLNEKYTDAWFLKENPQFWNNLRAMESLHQMVKDEEDDPIMKLNPTLYN